MRLPGGNHRCPCIYRAVWRVEYDTLWGLVRRVKYYCDECLLFPPHDPPRGMTISRLEE